MDAMDSTPNALQQIQEWEAALDGETVVSPSDVQHRLFELWGELNELPVGRTIETWLTLTVERELFGTAELLELLVELRNELQPADA